MKAAEILLHLHGVARGSDNSWRARCPAHDDHKASLSIGTGEDGRILLNCHVGCSVESIVGALGLKVADLFPPRVKDNRNCKPIVATYDYHDENGVLLFQCVRFEPKDFKQRRPDPAKAGKWIWNLKDTRRVLYRLREVLAVIKAGRTIFIAEGEKDCEVLVKAGFAATCNPMGAGKWLPEHTETLRGSARVAVIADKDTPGRNHAQALASALLAVAKSVKVIELPDANGKPVKDAFDFFAAGGSADKLRAIVKAAPEFKPASEPQPRKAGSVPNENPGEDENESDASEESKKQGRISAATRLVKFADEFAFFHDPHNRPLVRLDVNGHVEIWPVNSIQFRNLLAQTYYRRTRAAINRNALADAISTLAGRACYESPEEPVFLRIAPQSENIVIDLCDPHWRVIEVTATAWRVLDKSPVAFIRTGAMRPLPVPAPATEGSLMALWEMLNVTQAQQPLVAGGLLNYFHPYGPYFVTNFVGEQGSAKSCAARILRMLIDPNENPLRSPPREERDLLVHAANNWCVVLDNLSRLQPWLSDGLCRLSTGGGHSARQLYSDGEEFSLAVKRPVILNGIDDVAERPDLAERALQIELETIPDHKRISEKELWRKFEAARPVLFSATLNGLVCSLRELPNVKMDSLPRMADAALWAAAGETAFGWQRGTFILAYRQNLNEGAIASLDAHPVGVAVRQLLEKNHEWIGEPAQLLSTLNELASEELRHAQNWPKTPRALSTCLRRLAQAFRRAGIDADFTKRKRRTIRLCRRGDFASPASPASSDNPKADVGDAKDANLQPSHDENIQKGETKEEKVYV